MSEDQAYQDGYDAFEKGKKPSNPHSPFDAARHDAWLSGWLDARDETHLYTDDDRARQGLGMPNASEY